MGWEADISGKKVLVTGHTGFTGTWLCEWLLSLDCQVYGLSLAPNTEPSIYELVGLDTRMNSHIGDICDAAVCRQRVEAVQPELVFHLAAQPIVNTAYTDPLDTFNVNVMGTANVLEAVRGVASVRAVVCVTTDKVYENQDWHWPYREIDKIGGLDPYAASKSAAEMVIKTYQKALPFKNPRCAVAVARGGNIIGGGDWAADRIIPDIVRAIAASKPLVIRNPNATRPWQHAIALVHGYLRLAAALVEDPSAHSGAWNLGPTTSQEGTVGELVDLFGRAWEMPKVEYKASELHESRVLSLDSSKAMQQLAWYVPWDLEMTVLNTAHWYKVVLKDSGAALQITHDQLSAYRAALD